MPGLNAQQTFKLYSWIKGDINLIYGNNLLALRYLLLKAQRAIADIEDEKGILNLDTMTKAAFNKLTEEDKASLEDGINQELDTLAGNHSESSQYLQVARNCDQGSPEDWPPETAKKDILEFLYDVLLEETLKTLFVYNVKIIIKKLKEKIAVILSNHSSSHLSTFQTALLENISIEEKRNNNDVEDLNFWYRFFLQEEKKETYPPNFKKIFSEIQKLVTLEIPKDEKLEKNSSQQEESSEISKRQDLYTQAIKRQDSFSAKKLAEFIDQQLSTSLAKNSTPEVPNPTSKDASSSKNPAHAEEKSKVNVSKDATPSSSPQKLFTQSKRITITVKLRVDFNHDKISRESDKHYPESFCLMLGPDQKTTRTNAPFLAQWKIFTLKKDLKGKSSAAVPINSRAILWCKDKASEKFKAGLDLDRCQLNASELKLESIVIKKAPDEKQPNALMWVLEKKCRKKWANDIGFFHFVEGSNYLVNITFEDRSIIAHKIGQEKWNTAICILKRRSVGSEEICESTYKFEKFTVDWAKSPEPVLTSEEEQEFLGQTPIEDPQAKSSSSGCRFY